MPHRWMRAGRAACGAAFVARIASRPASGRHDVLDRMLTWQRAAGVVDRQMHLEAAAKAHVVALLLVVCLVLLAVDSGALGNPVEVDRSSLWVVVATEPPGRS